MSKKMGRPLKDIDKNDFESLCAMFCTLDEVVGFFDRKLGGCSDETVRRWLKKTYGRNETFVTVSKKFQGLGKVSLRRTQFKLSKKSPAMAIFLGKQYLGQKDYIANEVTGANGGAMQVENIQVYIPDNGRDTNSPSTENTTGES